MTPVVAIIGGGVSAAALIGLLPGALGFDEVEIRLAAQDLDRLKVIAGHGRALVADRIGWTVTAHPTPVAAATDADVVVVMVRVGGLAARRADEELSRSFGIPGDEGLGPGGAVNARRTLPVLAELADDIRAVAPGSTVLNLVAPLGITTRLLLDRGLDTIGVCELPAVTESALADAIASATASPHPIELSYAGLNHLGWFWAPDDASPPLDLTAVVGAGLADPGVLAAFGAVPLKYYYWLFDPAAADRLGIGRDPGRTDHLIELRDRALAELAAAPGGHSPSLAARPMPWFADALVPIVAAVLSGRPWRGFADVRNDGLLDGFDAQLVVETRASIVEGRFLAEPLAGPPPVAVRRFLGRAAVAEDLLYRSWTEDDDALVVEAFVEGPHAVDRSTARRLADAIRAGTRRPLGACP